MRKWIAAAIFAVFGLLLIPYAGIEADEAYFANALFGPVIRDFSVTVFHHTIPLMIYPYAGSLKALLYWPILNWLDVGPYAVRLPVVLTGTATVLLFYLFAERLAGSRAALIASLLLATDPSFLLTNTYDWGPVALEHFLLVAGCLLAARGRPAWGFFCFGLALWNKAIFVWALAGLATAVALAYAPETRQSMARRRMIVCCAAALLAGTLPLIVFNLHRPNATMRANVHLSTDGFATKLISLRATLDGSALFGVVVAQEAPENAKAPVSIHGRISAWIRDHAGAHYSSLFFYALVLGMLLVPVWWKSPQRRAAVFAITFVTVAFLAMALTRYTGAPHHIALLYPMPQLFVGVSLSALRWRRLAAGIAAVVIAANLLVMNQYLTQFERNGAGRLFTDALYPLSSALEDSSGQIIHVADWGIAESLNLLHRGKLKLVAEWPILTAPEQPALSAFEKIFADQNGVVLTHTAAFEQFPGNGKRLDAAARSLGYEKRIIRIIPDTNGRAAFEILRFERP